MAMRHIQRDVRKKLKNYSKDCTALKKKVEKMKKAVMNLQIISSNLRDEFPITKKNRRKC
jgi:hypothetical protein